jgi:exonuclease SbcD
MAHLFAQGATISESERKFKLETRRELNLPFLGKSHIMLLLGHIHRPQIVGKPHIRYGSPIALSFSEKEDRKEVIILEMEGSEFKISSLPVPKSKLISIKGTVEEVQ